MFCSVNMKTAAWLFVSRRRTNPVTATPAIEQAGRKKNKMRQNYLLQFEKHALLCVITFNISNSPWWIISAPHYAVKETPVVKKKNMASNAEWTSMHVRGVPSLLSAITIPRPCWQEAFVSRPILCFRRMVSNGVCVPLQMTVPHTHPAGCDLWPALSVRPSPHHQVQPCLWPGALPSHWDESCAHNERQQTACVGTEHCGLPGIWGMALDGLVTRRIMVPVPNPVRAQFRSWTMDQWMVVLRSWILDH